MEKERKFKRLTKQKAVEYREIRKASYQLSDLSGQSLCLINKLLHDNVPTYQKFLEEAGMYHGNHQIIEYTDKSWKEYQKYMNLKGVWPLDSKYKDAKIGVVFTEDEQVYICDGSEPVPGKTKPKSFVKPVFQTLDDPCWFAFVCGVLQVARQNKMTLDDIISLDN